MLIKPRTELTSYAAFAFKASSSCSSDKKIAYICANLINEFDGKRLRQTFQHLYPSKHIVFNKADGLFCYHGQPLALLEPQIDGPSKIKWHLVAVANADVNRADVQADFLSRQRARARAADVPWSG